MNTISNTTSKVSRKAFRTIFKPTSAFGGFEYKITTDGETAHVLERSPESNSFVIVLRERMADIKGLLDRLEADGDPGRIARYIDLRNA